MHTPHLLASTRLHWRRAFVESMLATIICALVVGIVFLPREIDRVRAKPAERILFCAPAADGKSIYSVIASINMWEADAIHATRLVTCGVTAIAPNARAVCENLGPQCATLEANSGRLFVGDARGGLHFVNLQSD